MAHLRILTSDCVPEFQPVADWVRFWVKNHSAVVTFDGDLFALEVVHVSQQDFLPVAAVTDEPQVRERSFRRSHLLFHFGQQITYSKQISLENMDRLQRSDSHTG